ncbi:alpha-ketoglutarate-dependent dioxygenase AlkB [Mangrovimonas sp. DI 80]|uniref:alpha-ketoglutarate-dependent dioxygenase AlkB family protein n=1 Tax=Mangrovimonas sp. DI 80 TaxID=1779330 RepID=UPI000977C9A6|nr:alpha-ketoglutarate-dependent dioxygenase AlkB [Mangrovimonas sp. DI 80]OMP31086.1 alpha-ketoglutarate-dependent dioxygenase AlkB [Mangrovimonas sp. DI 80]
MDLFSGEKLIWKLPDAELIYIANFFSNHEASNYFERLLEDINWQQDEIKVFGKTYQQPRLTALYGESNTPYSYSGITMHPNPFSKDLLEIKTKVEEETQHHFNSVLLNLYRNGNDSNGWHADNEASLGIHPVIASVSFGEERYFHFKHRQLKNERHKVLLQHGSLLIMKGAMQEHWLHQIAKTKRKVGSRINLTFRKLI